MNLIPLNVGGTIRWRAPERASATPTVIIYNEGGGEEVASQNATLSSVNTPLNGAVAAAATSLTLTSGTGVVVGDRYRVGPNAAGQYEFVTVAGVTSAHVVTLQFPIVNAYGSGVVFAGTYQSIAVTAAQAARVAKNWRAVFSWVTAGPVSQPPGIVRFDVVRHWVNHVPATMDDVRTLDPKVQERVASTFDHTRNLLLALDDVLRDVNTNLVAPAVLDVNEDEWADLVAHRALVRIGASMGSSGPGSAYRELWEARYIERLAVLKSQLIIDSDQDGAVEPNEESVLGGFIWRG